MSKIEPELLHCSANKINIHPVTGNSNVFSAQLPGVFRLCPGAEDYTTSLFETYKVNNMKSVNCAMHR